MQDNQAKCVRCKTNQAEQGAATCAQCKRDLVYQTQIARAAANAQLSAELRAQAQTVSAPKRAECAARFIVERTDAQGAPVAYQVVTLPREYCGDVFEGQTVRGNCPACGQRIAEHGRAVVVSAQGQARKVRREWVEAV